MKKKMIIITTVVIMLLSVVSSLPVFAYVAPASLYDKYSSNNISFTAPSNGILLIHSFYKCNISPSAPGLSLLDMLDDSYLFKSGSSTPIIWQGVQYDSDSINLSDVEKDKFEQIRKRNSAECFKITTALTRHFNPDTFIFGMIKMNTDTVKIKSLTITLKTINELKRRFKRR